MSPDLKRRIVLLLIDHLDAEAAQLAADLERLEERLRAYQVPAERGGARRPHDHLEVPAQDDGRATTLGRLRP